MKKWRWFVDVQPMFSIGVGFSEQWTGIAIGPFVLGWEKA